jgi:pimeloyl-ACP methyl ester carboxylesterase
MSTVETPTGQLHYTVCDIVPGWVESPETIVFHHGIAANTHIWADWLPILATRYRLVCFDMRGFGQSVVPAREFNWSYDVLIDDLLAVAKAAGAERFHLVGESIGGTAALAFTLKVPEKVLSLCLSNAAARGGLVTNVKGWREIVTQGGQAGWARQMMEWRFHPDALSPEVHAWYTRVHESCSMDASFGLADLLLASDLTPRLSEIKVPTLLLTPEASPFIPLDVMASMRAVMPDAELQVFAHSKHGLPLSHGSECAQVLREFLQRRFSPGSRAGGRRTA